MLPHLCTWATVKIPARVGCCPNSVSSPPSHCRIAPTAQRCCCHQGYGGLGRRVSPLLGNGRNSTDRGRTLDSRTRRRHRGKHRWSLSAPPSGAYLMLPPFLDLRASTRGTDPKFAAFIQQRIRHAYRRQRLTSLASRAPETKPADWRSLLQDTE